MNPGSRIIPFVILCVLQVGDLVSTQLALRIPGVHELNPLVRDLGLWPAKLLAFAIIVFLAWRAKTIARLWAVCGFYAAVVASNVLLFVSHARLSSRG